MDRDEISGHRGNAPKLSPGGRLTGPGCFDSFHPLLSTSIFTAWSLPSNPV
jgi:hypothetical protein